MLIYKIFRPAEWAALQSDGQTAGAPVDLEDGFIHFSSADQVVETAGKHFADADNLVLAAVDADRLGDELKWETSRGGALFPHLYRDLDVEDLTWAKPLPRMGDGHVFPEEISGFIDPTRPQFDTFKSLDRDHAIEMLNLVRLRDHAAYPTEHPLADEGLSGAEAYAHYGRETIPILERIGASIVWRGGFQSMLIGPDSETWDHMFIARYPSAHAFLDMVTDPDYQRAVVHRQAAVRSSRLIRTAPLDAGVSFG